MTDPVYVKKRDALIPEAMKRATAKVGPREKTSLWSSVFCQTMDELCVEIGLLPRTAPLTREEKISIGDLFRGLGLLPEGPGTIEVHFSPERVVGSVKVRFAR